jgi:hypothetical protein
MQLWCPFWLPLYAFFVDWDRLFQWVQAKFSTLPAPASPTAIANIAWGGRHLLATTWIVFFVGAYLGAGCIKKQMLFTFPFTSYPMYCDLLVQPPYDQHMPATLYGSTWSFDAEPPDAKAYVRQLWLNDRNLPWHTKWDARCRILAAACAHTKSTRITLAKTSFQILPFPAKAVAPVQSALSCILAQGEFQGLETTNGWDKERQRYYVEITPHGFDNPRYRFGYHRNNAESWQPLEVEQVGNRYYYEKNPGDVYWLSVFVQDDRVGTSEVAFDAGAFRK